MTPSSDLNRDLRVRLPSMLNKRLHDTKTPNLIQFIAPHSDSIVHLSLKTQLRLWPQSLDFIHKNIQRHIILPRMRL
jgi:hypothetical protein